MPVDSARPLIKTGISFSLHRDWNISFIVVALAHPVGLSPFAPLFLPLDLVIFLSRSRGPSSLSYTVLNKIICMLYTVPVIRVHGMQTMYASIMPLRDAPVGQGYSKTTAGIEKNRMS